MFYKQQQKTLKLEKSANLRRFLSHKNITCFFAQNIQLKLNLNGRMELRDHVLNKPAQ
jgi:hypothetical protein